MEWQGQGMLRGRNLAAIAVIVALITGDLALLAATRGGWPAFASWLALWPYLVLWAAVVVLSVYAVLKNGRPAH